MSDRESFLRVRRTGIGGSDVGAIVGVDPYKTALDVYLEKVGETPEVPRTKVMERGIKLEPLIRQEYVERSGRTLKAARFRRHPKHKWMIGHPDGLITGDAKHTKNVTDQPGILECKSLNYHVYTKMVEKGLYESYQLQGVHYGTLCGHKWVAFALLHPDSWSYATLNLEIDPAIAKQVVDLCEHFWFNHVAPKIPPKEVEPEWKIELPAVEGIVETRGSEEWRAAIEAYVDARAMVKEAESIKTNRADAIKKLCSRFGVFEGAGARVYNKLIKGRKNLDAKALRAARLLDPMRVAGWLVKQGITMDMLPPAEEWRANIDDFVKTGKPYGQLKVYHISEEG